jgi:hypothetical protein
MVDQFFVFVSAAPEMGKTDIPLAFVQDEALEAFSLLGNLLAKPIVFSFRHEKSCSER